MRKGEEKRQELLNAAEKLFCQQGYEKTSVQDILGVTGLSKGGFYHHFSGKDEVLAALCSRHAERAAAYTTEALNQAGSPMGRINAVLRGFMPLRREEADFIALLLPVICKPEGRGVSMIYQDALENDFLPLLRAEIAAAAAVQVVFPQVKDMERVILNTVNHAWMTVAAAMVTAREKGQRLESAACLTLLEKYRRTIELLLDAPYGSIEILRVEEVEEINRLIS
ncbi:MAG: TetR/AcrR family transcriptional regulator [Clostridiales bacterium]|nr:TetR/AcrR family transcriptional regulator [Clostridiales bacterium]